MLIFSRLWSSKVHVSTQLLSRLGARILGKIWKLLGVVVQEREADKNSLWSPLCILWQTEMLNLGARRVLGDFGSTDGVLTNVTLRSTFKPPTASPQRLDLPLCGLWCSSPWKSPCMGRQVTETGPLCRRAEARLGEKYWDTSSQGQKNISTDACKPDKYWGLVSNLGK